MTEHINHIQLLGNKVPVHHNFQYEISLILQGDKKVLLDYYAESIYNHTYLKKGRPGYIKSYLYPEHEATSGLLVCTKARQTNYLYMMDMKPGKRGEDEKILSTIHDTIRKIFEVEGSQIIKNISDRICDPYAYVRTDNTLIYMGIQESENQHIYREGEKKFGRLYTDHIGVHSLLTELEKRSPAYGQLNHTNG